MSASSSHTPVDAGPKMQVLRCFSTRSSFSGCRMRHRMEVWKSVRWAKLGQGTGPITVEGSLKYSCHRLACVLSEDRTPMNGGCFSNCPSSSQASQVTQGDLCIQEYEAP
ncbi:hypothetical protein FKM82_029618 [Ascaphus truei]